MWDIAYLFSLFAPLGPASKKQRIWRGGMRRGEGGEFPSIFFGLFAGVRLPKKEIKKERKLEKNKSLKFIIFWVVVFRKKAVQK